ALMSRGWLEIAVAVFAVVATAATATVSSEELRWYAAQLGLYPASWQYSQPTSLDVLRLDSSHDGATQVATLVTFALALAAVAVFGRAAAHSSGRLAALLGAARRAQHDAEALAESLLERGTDAECVVAELSGEVVKTNAAFEARFPAVVGGGLH